MSVAVIATMRYTEPGLHLHCRTSPWAICIVTGDQYLTLLSLKDYWRTLTFILNPVYTTQPVVKPVVNTVVKPVWQLAVSCIQPVVIPVVQRGLTTGWTNSGCSFNTVVKPVWQPDWQPVVLCKRGITSRQQQTDIAREKMCGKLAKPYTHLTFHQPSRRASSTSTGCSFLKDNTSGSMLS